MRITIESVEAKFDNIRADHDDLVQLLEFKNVKNHYCQEVIGTIKIHLPRLEQNVRDLIDECSVLTESEGHSQRLDYIKDVLFLVLGKCIGDDLTDNRFNGVR